MERSFFRVGEAMMLDFLLNLEQLLKIWPDNAKWNIVQIAEQSRTQIPHVHEYLSGALNKSIDIHDPLTFNEVSKAHAIISERYKVQLEGRRLREKQAIEDSIRAYDFAQEKIRVMLTAKNWRGAYKTLSYFYGINKNLLPGEIITSVCDNCLRIGIRANINFQELSGWLKLGIDTLMSTPSLSNFEDALDFLDAYGEYFLDEPKGKGEQFITNLFLTLKPSAMEYDLTPRFNQVAGDLSLTAVMDEMI